MSYCRSLGKSLHVYACAHMHAHVCEAETEDRQRRPSVPLLPE